MVDLEQAKRYAESYRQTFGRTAHIELIPETESETYREITGTH